MRRDAMCGHRPSRLNTLTHHPPSIKHHNHKITPQEMKKRGRALARDERNTLLYVCQVNKKPEGGHDCVIV